MPRLTRRSHAWVCLVFTGLPLIWAASAQADADPSSMSAPMITSLSPGAATFFTPVEDSPPQTLPPDASAAVLQELRAIDGTIRARLLYERR